MREALEICAPRGTEWVLGTRRGHLGQGSRGRGGAEMEQGWGAELGARVADSLLGHTERERCEK